MACGVKKTMLGGRSVVCDNPGTSSHPGPHSGLYSLFGFQVRTYWTQTSVEKTPAAYKRPLRGLSARSPEGWLEGNLAPALTPMGMYKTGNQASIPRSWTKLSPMITLDGNPDTEIEDDCLVMNGSGRVRISYRAEISASGFAYTISKRCMKNGEVLHSTGEVSPVHTVETDVESGDLIWFEMSYSGTVFSFTLTGDTRTYMRTEVI